MIKTQGSHRPGGDELLLGYQKPSGEGFGFAQRVADAQPSRRLITHQQDSHLITFASTGCGKGRSAIVPNLLNYRGTAVVVDVKNGELTRITARRRREFGPVHVIDPFGVTDAPKAGINPFDVFDWPGSQVEPDAEWLASLLATGNFGVKDPFWDQHGMGLLAGVMGYGARLPVEQRSLCSLVEKLMSDDIVYNLAVLLDTIGKQLPKMCYREIATFLQHPDVTRGGILATTLSYLKTLHTEAVLEVFRTSTVDLCDFVDGKPMTIYIVLPVERIQSHRAILKVLLGVLLKGIVSRKYKPETRTLLLIDECGQLGTFPFLETFVTLCRSFGCWAWTFFQDLAQLRSCYPSSWKTILNNSGVIQAFGFHNRDLAEQWSNYFDSSPSQLRELSTREQVLMIPGAGESRCLKLDYLEDEAFAGLFDSNPLYEQGPSFRSQLRPPGPPLVAGDAAPESTRKTERKRAGSSGSSGGRQAQT